LLRLWIARRASTRQTPLAVQMAGPSSRARRVLLAINATAPGQLSPADHETRHWPDTATAGLIHTGPVL